MIVLSLFDGMACGYEALKRANVPVTKYYASEIDKYAMQIAKKNHPDIIHVGDVNKWQEWDIEKPDLIIGGSPCQGFSFAGKRLAFDDPRSKLFFTMIDIIEHYKPRYKMLENVKMKKEYLDVISQYMGVEPMLINSSLVSAQNRQRYYWFNWDVSPPEDMGIIASNILVSGKAIAAMRGRYIKDGVRQDGRMLTAGKTRQYIEFRHDGKSNALTTVAKDNVVVDEVLSERIFATDFNYRFLSTIECERLQTLPDNYTEGVSNTQRYKMIGNGWTVDVIAHIFKGLQK